MTDVQSWTQVVWNEYKRTGQLFALDNKSSYFTLKHFPNQISFNSFNLHHVIEIYRKDNNSKRKWWQQLSPPKHTVTASCWLGPSFPATMTTTIIYNNFLVFLLFSFLSIRKHNETVVFIFNQLEIIKFKSILIRLTKYRQTERKKESKKASKDLFIL